MKEYLLLFRAQPGDPNQIPSEQAMAESMEKWKNWIGGIAANGKLTGGQPLTREGRLLSSRTKITDTPLAEGKEVVNGYLIVKGDTYDEAVEMSKGCPIFDDNGSVEVREIMAMDIM